VKARDSGVLDRPPYGNASPDEEIDDLVRRELTLMAGSGTGPDTCEASLIIAFSSANGQSGNYVHNLDLVAVTDDTRTWQGKSAIQWPLASACA
jgi:hypothetical protein